MNPHPPPPPTPTTRSQLHLFIRAPLSFQWLTSPKKEEEEEEDAMLSDRRECFLTFCFFLAVVPFQHGSASPGHQSHTSRKRKEEKKKTGAGGAAAVWCSHLFKQVPWTSYPQRKAQCARNRYGFLLLLLPLPLSPPPSPPSPPPPFIVHPFPAPTGQAINGPLIFTTAAKAHAEDSATNKTNIPLIFSCAFKMKVATRGPPGDGGRGAGGTCEPLTFISSHVMESLIDLLKTIN